MSKTKPIDPARTDFGAILGRCLNEMGIERITFAKALDIHGVVLSAMINNPCKLPTPEWIDDKDILKKLERYNPSIFSQYRDKLQSALQQPRTSDASKPRRQNAVRKKPKSDKKTEKIPQLSADWETATSDYLKAIIKFSGDTINDVIDAIKSEITSQMPPSITSKFLQSTQFWHELQTQSLPEKFANYARSAVTALNNIYYIDEQHKLYPKRTKAEIALGIK